MAGIQQLQAGEPDNGRLLQFSDGVFAVAITLLVFSLKLPDPQAVAEGHLAQSVWESRNQFFSFALSFAVVGNFWIAHHCAFRLIRTHDTGLIWLNLLFLLGISILPYPSSLLGQYSEHRFSVVFYAACMASASLSVSLLWWYARATGGWSTRTLPTLRSAATCCAASSRPRSSWSPFPSPS